MSSERPAMRNGVLFTDQYELTMAQLYFRQGLHETTAQFDHFFRSYPAYDSHQAGYCVNAGLEWLVDWMQSARFHQPELEFLRSQTGRGGDRVFSEDFLDWLHAEFSFNALSMRAVPEGRVVHPDTPLTVVKGPLAVAQVLETALLNILNYQTLVATKTSRIASSARGGTVLEFGLRRAQGKGGNAGTRAALIGGASFSSNVGVSHELGIPPKGTHAHSMVQAFIASGGSELDAFRAYAEVYPDDCLLLVDTVDTLESGVPNAIRVFEELAATGHTPVGIRLDSGDLAYLSIRAARMLDDAGFEDALIVLSNQLDELVIWQILSQIEEEAASHGVDPDALKRRLTYGVGTRLITSTGSPALDGVYKLVGLRTGNQWRPAMKVSEVPGKTVTPGDKQLIRFYDRSGHAVTDFVARSDETFEDEEKIYQHHPRDGSVSRVVDRSEISEMERLHRTILQDGTLKHEFPEIQELRDVRASDLDRLHAGVRRIVNPHTYHVSLSRTLWDLKRQLMDSAH